MKRLTADEAREREAIEREREVLKRERELMRRQWTRQGISPFIWRLIEAKKSPGHRRLRQWRYRGSRRWK